MNRSRVFLSTALLALVVLPAAAPAQTFRSAGGIGTEAMLGFSSAVAVGDGEVLVGESGNNMIPGIVYVYRMDEGGAGSWTEAARLTASTGESGDRFGSSLAVAGNRMIVGSTQPDSGRGVAFIFQKSAGGDWVEMARLVPEGAEAGDHFGAAVALAGDLALVGSAAHAENTGAVRAFRRDGSGKWLPVGSPAGAELEPGDRFGASLSIDGTRALVGSPGHEKNAGLVFVFDFDGAAHSWKQTARLESGAVEKNDRFGSSLALSGDLALVGSPRFNRFIGAVFTFEFDSEAGEWSEATRLVPFDGSRQNRFGSSLAFDGTHAWIGAPGANGFQGVVYLLSRNAEGGGWADATKLTAGDLQRGDFFSGTVAAGSDLAVVGVPGDDYGAGSAMIYRLQDGHWVSSGRVMSEVEGMDAIAGSKVACQEGSAAGFDCSQMDLTAFVPVSALGGGRGVRVNDIWGWTDPRTGREYAIVGRSDGTAFVDVTDAYNPVYVGNLPKTAKAPGSVWRDMKVYHDHVFVVADGAGEHGMQVFDLTQLRKVRNPPVVFEETAHYDRIHSAHNIVINEETGFAYAVGASAGGETCGGGLHMINIQDPEHPVFAGCFADPETGRAGTGYTHDAMCIIYHGPDTEHQGREICFGSNETALSIADVTDKAAPRALSHAAYPNVGYAHQGWITEDHKYFYLDDELDELQGKVDHTRTLVWDVTDLDDPVLVKEYMGTTPSIDHNLYIKGTTMYQSNYVAGLRVVDISDPENPHEVGYFDTVPYGDNSPSFNGSWSNYPYFASGTIVVTSGREGLFLLRTKEQPTP